MDLAKRERATDKCHTDVPDYRGPHRFYPATVAISGRWSTDNFGDDIILNGVSTGQTKGGFTTWGPFSLNSGFIAGVNTIDFVIRDVGVISGFRAEFLSAEGVLIPLPPAIVLFSFGLAGIWRLNVGARSRANRRQPFFIAKAPVPPHSRR